jgi:colicin import membrane protein
VKSDLDRIQTALIDKRAPQRQAVTGTMINPAPSLGSTTGTALQLSQNELAMLIAQLRSCWAPPVGVVEAKDLVVTVRFSLNRDGSLLGEPIVVNRGRNALFQLAAEAATRAVRVCQPFRLPASKYEAWQEVEVNFDPILMFGG